MTVIPDPVLKLILDPDSNKTLTTVSPDGEPHSIVCGSLTVEGKDKIVVGEVMMHKTSENLKKNPHAEILVWKGKFGYSIKATASDRVTEGPSFDKMHLMLSKKNMAAVAVWRFDIDSIWDSSASFSAGDRVV